MEDVYIRLARHLKDLIMGYPFSETLIDLLKEMFTPTEAQVALSIPNNLLPLEVVEMDKRGEGDRRIIIIFSYNDHHK